MDTVEGLVSVLMPALNEEATLAGSVDSVLRQQQVDVEVLILDGGSADQTRAVASELVRADPRVRLLENPLTTIPHALNIGLRNARGEYVARVDCHATISPDYHSRGLNHLRRDPLLAGVGGLRRGVSDSARGRAVALALSSRFGVGNSVYHHGTSYQFTDHASFGVYRSDVARAIGGWDDALAVNEDVDFDHRILQGGHRLAFDPAMTIDWEVRKDPLALFKQYRRYGRGKAQMVRKNGPAAMRARHLAAPLAVSWSVVLVVASLRRRVVLVGMAPYVGAVLVASVRAWRRKSGSAPVAAAAIPAAFVAMHAGWGIGFIEGLALRLRPSVASGSAALADGRVVDLASAR